MVAEAAGLSPLAAGCMEDAHERAAATAAARRAVRICSRRSSCPAARAVEVLDAPVIDTRE
ncbi:hypothetical protein GCM10023238_25090 [Streptomyces heliomycini]